MTLFGRESLCVVLSEDMARCPEAFMSSVFGFLGAEPGFAAALDYTKANLATPGAAKHVDTADLEWLVEHYRPHNRRLESLINRSLDAWENPFTER